MSRQRNTPRWQFSGMPGMLLSLALCSDDPHVLSCLQAWNLQGWLSSKSLLPRGSPEIFRKFQLAIYQIEQLPTPHVYLFLSRTLSHFLYCSYACYAQYLLASLSSLECKHHKKRNVGISSCMTGVFKLMHKKAWESFPLAIWWEAQTKAFILNVCSMRTEMLLRFIFLVHLCIITL